ncbi:helix-turn-helix domain-containing protein [Streptomyces sp. NPDC002896]|uniref:IclR family transcriptional regulator n=1 Tax=Streptomyces sp. NPDC002896 TaxID=3154438 RepID=UPI0033201686
MVRPALAATRSVAILSFFAAHPGGSFTLSEISSALGINLASTLSVLQALEDAGYLVRHPRRKTYELGPYPVALGDAALRGNPAVDLARGRMRALAEELGTETVISAAVAEDVVILATEGTPQVASADVRPGQRVPLIPPLGQVFYAWSPEGRVEGWLKRLDPRVQPMARIYMPAALTAVRQRGYSAAVESPTRVEIGTVLQRLADNPAEADELHDRLNTLAAALSEHDYELIDIEPDALYHIAALVAPVHDSAGSVAFALTVNGLRQVTGRQVMDIGEALAAIARGITKETGGRIPAALPDAPAADPRRTPRSTAGPDR